MPEISVQYIGITVTIVFSVMCILYPSSASANKESNINNITKSAFLHSQTNGPPQTTLGSPANAQKNPNVIKSGIPQAGGIGAVKNLFAGPSGALPLTGPLGGEPNNGNNIHRIAPVKSLFAGPSSASANKESNINNITKSAFLHSQTNGPPQTTLGSPANAQKNPNVIKSGIPQAGGIGAVKNLFAGPLGALPLTGPLDALPLTGPLGGEPNNGNNIHRIAAVKNLFAGPSGGEPRNNTGLASAFQ